VVIASTTALMLHELGHYLTARALKAEVMQVTVGCGPTLMSVKKSGILWSVALFPFTASVAYHPSVRETPLKYLAILLAGPLANLLTGAAALGLTWSCWHKMNPDLDQLSASALLAFLWMAGALSVAIGVFNLIPLAPLDGSAIIATALSASRGRSCKPPDDASVRAGIWIMRVSTLGLISWIIAWSVVGRR
jgi:membrane-associated protease RseP (regulator of RpoE activity)